MREGREGGDWEGGREGKGDRGEGREGKGRKGKEIDYLVFMRVRSDDKQRLIFLIISFFILSYTFFILFELL